MWESAKRSDVYLGRLTACMPFCLLFSCFVLDSSSRSVRVQYDPTSRCASPSGSYQAVLLEAGKVSPPPGLTSGTKEARLSLIVRPCPPWLINLRLDQTVARAHAEAGPDRQTLPTTWKAPLQVIKGLSSQ